MTKKWWIFLLRLIIFHRKSPPYKTPSERRYRAKREKPVTESRGIMIYTKDFVWKTIPLVLPYRQSFLCLHFLRTLRARLRSFHSVLPFRHLMLLMEKSGRSEIFPCGALRLKDVSEQGERNP